MAATRSPPGTRTACMDARVPKRWRVKSWKSNSEVNPTCIFFQSCTRNSRFFNLFISFQLNSFSSPAKCLHQHFTKCHLISKNLCSGENAQLLQECCVSLDLTHSPQQNLASNCDNTCRSIWKTTSLSMPSLQSQIMWVWSNSPNPSWLMLNIDKNGMF